MTTSVSPSRDREPQECDITLIFNLISSLSLWLCSQTAVLTVPTGSTGIATHPPLLRTFLRLERTELSLGVSILCPSHHSMATSLKVTLVSSTPIYHFLPFASVARSVIIFSLACGPWVCLSPSYLSTASSTELWNTRHLWAEPLNMAGVWWPSDSLQCRGNQTDLDFDPGYWLAVQLTEGILLL